MRKTLATMAIAGSVLAGGITFASPAAAVGSCSDVTINSRDFDLPGLKPDTRMFFEHCTDVTSGKVTAHSSIFWQMLEDQVQDKGKRWTSVKVTNRLESRTGPSEPDRIVTSRTCDFTAQMNEHWAGNSDDQRCTAPSATFDANLWYSSDATVVYDIEGDGKGAITWNLTGSPLLH